MRSESSKRTSILITQIPNNTTGKPVLVVLSWLCTSAARIPRSFTGGRHASLEISLLLCERHFPSVIPFHEAPKPARFSLRMRLTSPERKFRMHLYPHNSDTNNTTGKPVLVVLSWLCAPPSCARIPRSFID